MKQFFQMMAHYNRWANMRLYLAASELPGEHLNRSVGVYFNSLYGTLHHLLITDRIWLNRLAGPGLDVGQHDESEQMAFAALFAARQKEDERLQRFVEGLSEVEINSVCQYTSLKGQPQQQPVAEILAHLFNHQTHHRGQAHTALSLLGIKEPVALDLLLLQRETKAAPR